MVNLDANELTCGTEVRDIVFLVVYRLDLDNIIEDSLQIWDADIVDILRCPNTVRTGADVGNRRELC